MIKLWTIGRQREKAHAAKFVRTPRDQALLFPVIDEVHNLIEGERNPAEFINVCRLAMTQGGSGAWTNTANWLRQVGNRLPEVTRVWEELAQHEDWKVRWRVACALYHDIPDELSDRIFACLRGDRSSKVRTYAVDRYENRPGPDRQGVKMFDANDPASPGFTKE